MEQFKKWMRDDVDRVFTSEGEGEWQKRNEQGQQKVEAAKAGKIAKIHAARYNSLHNALRSEKGKAARRLAKTPQSNSKLTASRQRSIARYEAQQAELERFAAGGAKSEDKAFRKLYGRIGRREDKAQKKIEAVERGQLLGMIANSFSVRYDKSSWEMFSNIPWANIHNTGGTAGNGANIPARLFLQWTPARLEKFVEMANEYVLKRAEKAGGKKK